MATHKTCGTEFILGADVESNLKNGISPPIPRCPNDSTQKSERK